MSAEGLTSPDGQPLVFAEDRETWREWLSANHDVARGAWLVFYKKGSGGRSVSYDEAVEEALAFGWIDSRANKGDETRYIQLFSPRKARSVWSQSNKIRVERLTADGRMTPAGMALVEAAKRNGQWDALDDIPLDVPDDLALALEADPVAARHFEAFPPSSRRIILVWIAGAKRAETRASRIAETVALAHDNVRANHYRQPKGEA